MVKNSSEPNSIANPWRSLSFPPKNHLINLLAELLQRLHSCFDGNVPV